MFRLAVASSALQCVTDAEDTQLATGQGRVWRCEADLLCVRVCVCVFLCVERYQSCALPYTLPRLRAFVRTCIWPHFQLVCEQREVREGAGDVRGMFEQCALRIPQSLPWGFCLSEWTHIFIYRTLPLHFASCPLCCVQALLTTSICGGTTAREDRQGSGEKGNERIVILFFFFFPCFCLSTSFLRCLLVAYLNRSTSMYKNVS